MAFQEGFRVWGSGRLDGRRCVLFAVEGSVCPRRSIMGQDRERRGKRTVVTVSQEEPRQGR